MVGFLLGLLFLGLIAGLIARMLVHSPRRLGCLGTALLGVLGSYAGGTMGVLLLHQAFDIRRASSLVGAVIGTTVVLAVWRRLDRHDRSRRRLRRF